jgi:ABC-type transporter Mla subunit MlaD
VQGGFTRREKLVGLIFLLVLIITKATLLIMTQGKGWFVSQRTYLMRFNQGHGLQQGSPVRMLNTEIGKVSSMRLSRGGEENQVEITVRVLAEYGKFICQDSEAEVAGYSLLESKYLEISPGSPDSPPLPENGTIPTRVRKTLADSLGEFFNKETLRQARQIYDNFSHVSTQLRTDKTKFDQALGSFSQAWQAFTGAEGSLGELARRQNFSGGVRHSLEQFHLTLQEAQKLLGALKPSIRGLEEITKQINEETAALQAILAFLNSGAPEPPAVTEKARKTSKKATAANKDKAGSRPRPAPPPGSPGKPAPAAP